MLEILILNEVENVVGCLEGGLDIVKVFECKTSLHSWETVYGMYS